MHNFLQFLIVILEWSHHFQVLFDKNVSVHFEAYVKNHQFFYDVNFEKNILLKVNCLYLNLFLNKIFIILQNENIHLKDEDFNQINYF